MSGLSCLQAANQHQPPSPYLRAGGLAPSGGTLAKQPTWAESPIRTLLATCPDCSDIVYMTQRCHFTYRNGWLTAEVRVEPLAHVCDSSEVEEAA